MSTCTFMMQKCTLLYVQLFPGCYLEKDHFGGSVNHVYSSIINPKFTSFPPPVKPAQVRSTQRQIRQIRHVSFTDSTFNLLQIRALKLTSVPQAAHQDMRWWRQQPGGSWCPHWDHICTHVLTGTPIKNKQIRCFGFENVEMKKLKEY